MNKVEHPAVAAHDVGQSKARSATVRARFAELWADRLHGPAGTAMFFLGRMAQDDIFNTAAALCYSTALGVVPALAVILGTMAAFPAFDRLRLMVQDSVTANLVPDAGVRIQQTLEQFVAAAGKLTVFGVAGLAITAILLLLTVESAFNRIFRVAHARPLLMRLAVLWAVLTIAPFLTGLSASLFGFFSTIESDADGLVANLVFGQVVPTIVTMAVLTFLYRGIPNRPVKLYDAAIGATVTALLLELLRVGFAFYVKRSTYGAIYGAVAAAPVFLLWIYSLWIMVMAGAVITAALPDWRLLRAGHGSGPGLKLALALAIIDLLAHAFQNGEGLMPETISEAVAVPPAGVLPVLEDLRRAQYAVVTEHGQWMLARDLKDTLLVDLVHRFGMGIGPAVVELRGTPLGERVCPYLEPAAKCESELLAVRLGDLLAVPENPNGPAVARPFRSQDEQI